MGSSDLILLETEKGTHEFAREEIFSVFHRKFHYNVVEKDLNIFITKDIENLESLAFTKRGGLILGEVDELGEISKIKLRQGKFFVRVIDSGKCHGTEDEGEIGNLLGGMGKISFSDPDFVILAYHLDRWYIVEQIYNRNNVEKAKRKAPLRPFFSPVSMDPMYASFLVNMGYFPSGSILLDPFCGGGGILMEAGIKGYRVFGVDIINEMAVGARMNLKYFGIRDYEIARADFLNLQFQEKFDGIVTDFPYGRNSHISVEREEFYTKSAEKMHSILKDNARACIVTDNTDNLRYFENYFNIDVVLQQKVHKSLTRNFTRLIRR